MASKAFHGGASFEVVGTDFQTLERSANLVSADVLDAWFDPAPNVIEKIKQHLAFSLRSSPPTHAQGLIATITGVRGVAENQILVGGGSSDLMFSMFPNLMKAGQRVVILDPMYGEYAHIFENVIGADLHRFQLDKEKNFEIDENNLVTFISQTNPIMVCIVNPNSPTGCYWPKESILRLCRTFENILFVIDEAYIDYIGKEHSAERNVSDYANLIVIKSMSKAYALSGARVAYAVCSESRQQALGKYIPPWSVGLMGQIAGVEALLNEPYYLQEYKETHDIRKQMIQGFSRLDTVKLYNSCANFLMLELFTTSADLLVGKLAEENIFIRNCNSMGVNFKNDFVRIAVKDATTSEKIVEKTIHAIEILT